MSKYTTMEIKAAQALCKSHAEICNVDEQDLWNLHSEDFIKDAKFALDAAGALELLEALEGMLEYSDLIDVYNSRDTDKARRAVQKARGIE